MAAIVRKEQLSSRYVKLLRNGKFVNVIEVPDPRIVMLESYKRAVGEFTIQPISAATARAFLRLRRV